MGNTCTTQHNLEQDYHDARVMFDPHNFTIYDKPDKLTRKAIIEHYMPATFPLLDAITSEDIECCEATWGWIASRGDTDKKEKKLSGLVLFVDEFFERLFQRSAKFRPMFDTVKERAGILARIVSFLLTGNMAHDKVLDEKYKRLGERHKELNIPFWMYGVLMQTLIETIAYSLAFKAGVEVMESWVRVCSYTLRRTLLNVIPFDDMKKIRTLEVIADHNVSEKMAFTALNARMSFEEKCSYSGHDTLEN